MHFIHIKGAVGDIEFIIRTDEIRYIRSAVPNTDGVKSIIKLKDGTDIVTSDEIGHISNIMCK